MSEFCHGLPLDDPATAPPEGKLALRTEPNLASPDRMLAATTVISVAINL